MYAVIKMSVDRAYRGIGISRALLERTIEEFERIKGKQLFLETNSALAPAIALFESSGFVKQQAPRAGSAFERSDVYMSYDPRKGSARPKPAARHRRRCLPG